MKSEVANICRPITFHNQYIPLSQSEEVENWAYVAFGAVDGIDVGDDLFQDKKAQDSFMELIWNDQKKFTKKMRTSSISHRIYALYTGNEEKERNFWEEKLQYPFFFFCRLQCCGKKEKLLKNKEQLENKLNIEEQLQTCIYLTYDNSDLLIVLKSMQYCTGAAIINKLHDRVDLSMQGATGCYLKSSFTVFAVSREIWKKRDFIKNIQSECISRVYLKLIERAQGNLNEITKKLNEVITKIQKPVHFKPVLGADDEILVLENIEIKDFLQLYLPGEGILSRENPVLYENAANVTTVIITDVENEKIIENIGFIQANKDEKKETDHGMQVYRQIINHMYKKLADVDTECEYKELYTILNVLPKFTGELFNDYLLFPLISPIDNLIHILVKNKESESLVDCSEKSQSWTLNKMYFYNFIKSFSMYVQSTVITDRHATQMMDFNEKIYDIPVKVNAFYNAYLYNVKSILNVNTENRYDLFVMPGMNSIVTVMELYPNHDLVDQEESRLVKAEIPEQSAYNIQNIMVILAHESAHYVGGEMLRDRETRYRMFCNSCAHIYTQYVWDSLGENDSAVFQKINRQQLEESELRVMDMLFGELNRRENKSYWEKILMPEADSKIRDQRYWVYSQKKMYAFMMTATVEQILIGIGPDIICEIFYPILFKLESDRQDQLVEEIWQITDRFTANRVDGTTRTTAKTMIDSLMQIYEETFADIISVLLLELGVKDYVSAIINNVSEQGMSVELLKSSDIMIRISLILVTILNAEEEFSNLEEQWEQELVSISKEEGEKEAWYEVSEEALRLWVECCGSFASEEAMRKEKKYEKNILYALRDEYILNNAFNYLKECVKNFKRYCRTEENNKEKVKRIEKIQKLYTDFSTSGEKTVEDQILKMVTFIEEYHNDLVKDWENTLNK